MRRSSHSASSDMAPYDEVDFCCLQPSEQHQRNALSKPPVAVHAERFKTKLCRRYSATGSCAYRDFCMFAHGDMELRTKEMNISDGLNSEEAIQAYLGAARAHTRAAAKTSEITASVRYKTKMCQNFVKAGTCPYETKCVFAHGDSELRTKSMNLRNKLVSEEAVKSYQRLQPLPPSMVSVHDAKVNDDSSPTGAEMPRGLEDQQQSVESSSLRLSDPARRSSQLTLAALRQNAAAVMSSSASPRMTPNTGASTPLMMMRRFRHEPYTPLASSLSRNAPPEPYFVVADDQVAQESNHNLGTANQPSPSLSILLTPSVVAASPSPKQRRHESSRTHFESATAELLAMPPAFSVRHNSVNGHSHIHGTGG